jgi:hypothetical protein
MYAVKMHRKVAKNAKKKPLRNLCGKKEYHKELAPRVCVIICTATAQHITEHL